MGTLDHSPAEICKHAIVDMGHGVDPSASSTTAWMTYSDGFPDKGNDSMIVVQSADGRDHGREHVSNKRVESHGVRVLIRSAAYTAGFVKGNAIGQSMDSFLDRTVNIGGTRYVVKNFIRTSDVLFLGRDLPSSKRFLFSINAQVNLEKL